MTIANAESKLNPILIIEEITINVYGATVGIHKFKKKTLDFTNDYE